MTEIVVMRPEDDGRANPMQKLALAQSDALEWLSQTKADKKEVADLRAANRQLEDELRVAHRQLEEQCAHVQAQMHQVHHQRSYWSVQALLNEVGQEANSEEKKALGRQLTQLSEELGIPKEWRPDDRWKKGLGVYHPFVWKEFCKRTNTPPPPAIKLAKDPR